MLGTPFHDDYRLNVRRRWRGRGADGIVMLNYPDGETSKGGANLGKSQGTRNW